MGNIQEEESNNLKPTSSTRREFLQQASTISAGVALISSANASGLSFIKKRFAEPGLITVSLTINEKQRTVEIDTRVTLLDLLRENLQLTGSKKKVVTGGSAGHVRL